MIISQDEVWKRLIENHLAIDGINTTTNKPVRYSDTVMVGATGQDSFILWPVHLKKAIRSQLETTLKTLFTDCENVEIQPGIKNITAGKW